MSKTAKTNTDGAEVLELRPLKAAKASERKWGKPAMALGFCIIPSLLLRAQQRLGLNATQLALLMHLADYWWDVDRKPYPQKKTLGERLGLSARQVQRYIAELEGAGLVRRIERTAPGRGKISNEYDLSGLVAKLRELAPEFKAAEEEARKAREAVRRPRARMFRAAADKGA
jgi:predicted transcriptional regulator